MVAGDGVKANADHKKIGRGKAEEFVNRKNLRECIIVWVQTIRKLCSLIEILCGKYKIFRILMRWDHSGIPLLFDLHLLSLLPCSCWKKVWKTTLFSLTKSFNLEHHIFVWIHSCCLAAFLIVLCSNNFIFISKSVLLISSTRYCYSRHLAMQIQWIIYSAR